MIIPTKSAILSVTRRCWLHVAARQMSVTARQYDSIKCKVLVLGAGSGGCAVAAQLRRHLGAGSVTVLEPADTHYYQPMFTMIGGGMQQLADSCKPMKAVIPSGVCWLKDTAMQIDAAANVVHTRSGQQVAYETLLVAVGLRLNFDQIPGLSEALQVPDGNVTSIYSPSTVHRHLNALKRFQFTDGPMLFTFPRPPVKCPGAPQKIAYISEHYLRRANKRDGVQMTYITALPVIFGVKYFADALWKIAADRGIDVKLAYNLVEVRGAINQAIFESMERPGERCEMNYGLLHVTPPQEVPEVLMRSVQTGDGLVNAAGFVDVDEQTLRHRRFENVWALGDCTSTPNSKTMAAAATQSGIVSANILATIRGRQPTASYNGYAACPLVTGYDRCVMAEFDYKLQPLETFPVSQNRELRSMFLMKKYAMPAIYWHGMLKGWWKGPALVRKALGIFGKWGN